MIVGILAFIYGVFYTTLPVMVLRNGFQGDVRKLVNFICWAFGAVLLLLGSPAIMQKWEWGRKIASIGCLVLIFLLAIFSLSDALGMLFIFILPLFGMLLMLHCKQFVKFFESEEPVIRKSDVGENQLKILLNKVVNYKHNLSFSCSFGILCLIYASPFLYIGWAGLSKPNIPAFFRSLFLFLGVGGMVIFLFFPLFIKLQEIGKTAYSIAFHLIFFNILVMVAITWNKPKELFNSFFFLIPLILILLVLHSENFAKTDTPDSAAGKLPTDPSDRMDQSDFHKP